MTAVRALVPYRVISRSGNIPWSSRLPDLTMCDFVSLGISQNKPLQTKATDKKTVIRKQIKKWKKKKC